MNLSFLDGCLCVLLDSVGITLHAVCLKLSMCKCPFCSEDRVAGSSELWPGPGVVEGHRLGIMICTSFKRLERRFACVLVSKHSFLESCGFVPAVCRTVQCPDTLVLAQWLCFRSSCAMGCRRPQLLPRVGAQTLSLSQSDLVVNRPETWHASNC